MGMTHQLCFATLCFFSRFYKEGKYPPLIRAFSPTGRRTKIPLQIPLFPRCAIWKTMTHQLCPANLCYFSRFVKGGKYSFPWQGKEGMDFPFHLFFSSIFWHYLFSPKKCYYIKKFNYWQTFKNVIL